MSSGLRLALFLLPAVGAVSRAAAQPTAGIIVVRALVGRPDRVMNDTMGQPYELPQPPKSVFSALLAAYAELKIPAEVNDTAQGEVGNQQFVRRYDLAGRRISAYLDCGEGLSGPYADSYKVDMSLVTFVTPTGTGGATVRSVLLGAAVDVGEGARPTQPCRSNGEFERRIYQAVRKHLGT